eukprot:CAMPEP_0170956052 /NCGR_PEP_ID=MMETSP0735-20130129/33660_1 /TAXON_ID=186038 /ORGANISM="Fragilariopsis kerguelensis, Strain L26-C5" /LENGTH=58 /DNA_ID=CAMNT_0011368271 /DNA_START=854 /DNA_END=1026 /DNA_ORIENTATION=+
MTCICVNICDGYLDTEANEDVSVVHGVEINGLLLVIVPRDILLLSQYYSVLVCSLHRR